MATSRKPTAATTRVLDVFRDLDPVTPKQIANATGLEQEVVEASLQSLADSGDVFLMSIWALTPARRAKNRQTPSRAAQAEAILEEQDSRTATGRRAKGVLEAEIMTYMRLRPDVDLGPYQVARGIGAKNGATGPAMARLAGRGELVKAETDKPRYRVPS